MIQFLKIFCATGFLVMLVHNIASISAWTESRAVYDDVCYLRQAHLFARFGAGGIDTNIARDDDFYFRDKLKAIGFESWADPAQAPCHTLMPASGKLVLQYPPGTGFVLSLFPANFQVIPLYVAASMVIAAFSLLSIRRASTIAQLTLVAAFGDSAIYLMINPTKASYSMAPTMLCCATIGFLTEKLFAAESARERLLLWLSVGFLVGLSVNFRLPNLLLSAGYFIFLLLSFLQARNKETFLHGFSFGTAYLVGIAPTLVANAINAGSPLTTTYGGVDVAPHELSLNVLGQYAGDMQTILLAIAVAWTILVIRFNRSPGARRAAFVVAGGLSVNIPFFMTHPIVTQYYTMPIAMLSLWTLLFVTLPARRPAAADNPALAQPVQA